MSRRLPNRQFLISLTRFRLQINFDQVRRGVTYSPFHATRRFTSGKRQTSHPRMHTLIVLDL